MNLVNMLTNSMTSEASLEALSEKSGTSTKQTSSLLQLALPILIKYMTQNASSQSGAQSLFGALMQHTDTSSMVQQFGNADAQDGNAIIGHILGDDSAQVVNTLSEQTGVGNDQVISLLGNMAPGMMSGLSAATTTAQNSTAQNGAYDFSSLMSAFGGAEEAQVETQAADTGMLEGLLGMGSGGSSSGLGMLGSLMGMDSSGSIFNSSNDGTSLISSLLGMLG